MVDIRLPLQTNEGLTSVLEGVEVSMPEDFEKDDMIVYDPIEP